MKKLSRLWRAFERAPGLAAIPAQWQQYCGSDYAVIQPFLKPTDMVAAAYPCHDCRVTGCTRDIIDCGDGQFLAVCRNSWHRRPEISMATGDRLLHQVNLSGFTRALAPPLGIRWQNPAVRADGTWAVGIACRRDMRGRPVFLVVLPAAARFRAAIERLLFDVPGPFVIVAPTNNHRTVEVQEHLQRRGLGFVALEDAVGLSDDRQFVALDPDGSPDQPLPTPVEDRPRTVREFTVRHKCKVKDIQVAASADEADYYKWLHGKIPDHYSTCIAIERVLRSGAPKPGKW